MKDRHKLVALSILLCPRASFVLSHWRGAAVFEEKALLTYFQIHVSANLGIAYFAHLSPVNMALWCIVMKLNF